MTRAPSTHEDAKQLATVSAMAALAGYELETQAGGEIIVRRWDGDLHYFDGLADAADWFRRKEATA